MRDLSLTTIGDEDRQPVTAEPAKRHDQHTIALSLSGGAEPSYVHNVLAKRMADLLDARDMAEAGKDCSTCLHQVTPRGWSPRCGHEFVSPPKYDPSSGRWSTRLETCYGERLTEDPTGSCFVGTGICGTPGRLHEPDGLPWLGHVVAAWMRSLRISGKK
jgi:hypothetical protein